MEAQKRKEAVDQMSSMMDGITERLNTQHDQMERQCKENAELRGKLEKMSEVVKLSETLRGKYEEECTRLGTEIQAKGELAEKAFIQLKESEVRHIETTKQVTELQGALQAASDTLKKTHKSSVMLANDKKVWCPAHPLSCAIHRIMSVGHKGYDNSGIAVIECLSTRRVHTSYFRCLVTG